jgi:hypothetical protein
MTENFNVILKSNASLQLCPKNYSSKFTNYFPMSVNVENYHVAVQSVVIDPNFTKIPLPILYGKEIMYLFTSEVKLKKWEPFKIITIPANATNPQDLVSKIKRQIGDRLRVNINMKYENKKISLIFRSIVILIREDVLNWFDIKNPYFSHEKYPHLVVISAAYQEVKIQSSADFLMEKQTPKYIRVVMSEMQQTLSSGKFHRTLAILVPQKYEKVLFHAVRLKEYYKLETENLNKISIALTDENYLPLQLKHSKPTIIILKFRQIMTKSFIVRVSSTESKNLFPNNKNTNFKVQLNEILEHETPMEVALTSIILPTDIDYTKILGNKESFFILIITTEHAVGENTKLEFTPDNFSSITEFITTLTEEIERTTGGAVIINKDDDNNIEFEFVREAGLIFSKLASSLFNKQTNEYMEYENKTWEVFTCEGKNNKKINFGKPSFLPTSPNFTYLKCNFITPTITASKFTQILKLIPLTFTEKENELLKHEVQHLDFNTVSMNDRTIFDFALCLENDVPLPYKNENSEVLITLLFREKKY